MAGLIFRGNFNLSYEAIFRLPLWFMGNAFVVAKILALRATGCTISFNSA